MKNRFFFSLMLIFFLAIGLYFIGCDSSNDNSLPEVIAVCESNINAGKIVIEFFQENPNRSVQSGNFYKITLNGNVISQGTIAISGGIWNFNPTSGDVTSFTGTMNNGGLTIPSIPYSGGVISDFGTQMVYIEGEDDPGEGWDPVP